MYLKRLLSAITRDERNGINENWEKIERGFSQTASDLNESHDKATEALSKSNTAKDTAQQAKDTAEYVQSQLDNVIADGDSLAEVVQARAEFVNLRDRLDSEFGQVTEQLAQTTDEVSQKVDLSMFGNQDNFIQRGNISPKIIRRVLDTYFITTQKPSKKGYVQFRMRDGIATTNVSVGGNAEFLRCTEVLDCVESFLMVNMPSAKSDDAIFNNNAINYTLVGIGQQSIPCTGITTRTVGAWVEYQVTTPRNVREIDILVYGTAASTTDAVISIDGTEVLTGVSFQRTTSQFFRLRVPLPASGTHTIRITTNTAEYMTIAGVNVVDLKDYVDGYNHDYYVNIANGTANLYVQHNGSMDYALLDGDTDLWCGSYHGGETRDTLTIFVDGVAMSITDGQYKVGSILEIEQETNIIGKIDTFSRQRFAADGERELQVVFDGNIKLKTLFTNMSTTKDDYTDVIYPKRDELATKDRVTLPIGCNYVIQRNPVNNQTCTTIFNQNKIASNELPFIKKTELAYNKVYNSNIQSDTGVLFTGGNFRVSHIFN